MHTFKKYVAKVLLIVLMGNSCSSMQAIDLHSLLKSAREKVSKACNVLKQTDVGFVFVVAVATLSVMLLTQPDWDKELRRNDERLRRQGDNLVTMLHNTVQMATAHVEADWDHALAQLDEH